MARVRPPDRLPALAAAATDLFIAQGYRRTRIDQVAAALGLAKGTVYLCVESKAALLWLALLHASVPSPFELDGSPGGADGELRTLPLATPESGRLAALVQHQLATDASLAALLKRLEAPPGRAANVSEELAEVVRGLFRTLYARRVGIKLLDRCAPDVPELHSVFYGFARDGLPQVLRGFLAARVAANQLRAPVDIHTASRMLLETVMTWAVHIHWDAAPRHCDRDVVERSVVELASRWWLP